MNEKLYGKVGAKNIVSWSVLKDGSVCVKTTDKSFTIPVASFNTNITDWNKFIDILLGDKVIVDDFTERR